MKYYKVHDGDRLGTLSFTHTAPITKQELRGYLLRKFRKDKAEMIIPISRLAIVRLWNDSPNLDELLQIYNLSLEPAEPRIAGVTA